jgi:hypothetical protein
MEKSGDFFPPKKKVEIWVLENKTHIFSAILKKIK